MEIKSYFHLFIFTVLVVFVRSTSSQPDKPISFQTIVLTGEVNKVDTRLLNNTFEYVYQYTFNISTFKVPLNDFDEDIRVHVSTTNKDTETPVLFVVRQKKAVLSWPLPILSNFDNKLYNVASRTLCGEVQEGATEKTIYVIVSTSSEKNVSFSIQVSLEHNFIMRLNESSTTDVSPLSPRFYRFVFPSSPVNRFVLLEVVSEDDRCMTVSVQNASCPILDQENNVQFEGYWQTMKRKAGMTLRKEDFPNGFYVVFVMHGDNSRCDRVANNEEEYTNWMWTWFDGDIPRVKNVKFIVTEKISDLEYLAAIFGTVGIFMLFYVFSFIVSCAYLCRKDLPPVFPIEEDAPGTSQTAGRGHRHNYPSHPEINTPIESEISPIILSDDEVDGERDLTNAEPTIDGICSSGISNNNAHDDRHHQLHETTNDEDSHWLASDSSLDETDIDMLEDAMRDKNVYRTTTGVTLSALARKNPRIIAKKSQLYLWTLMTVAIFYGLPVVQLVFTYQNVLHTTGNQDLCYYNYLCSHPLGLLSDFNHVYSNTGYIMLGFLYLLLVMRKEKIHERLLCRFPNIDLKYGIPSHFGLFYAMGLALIMEGVLSACYHVCPCKSNFQFDTCFMYVNAMLLMLKIYQARHPDINISAYMAFAALAIVVLLGVVGVLAGNIYFWVMFSIFHVLMGFYLSVQIYYLGRWRLDCGMFKRIYNTWKNDCFASPLMCLRPLYIDRMILLLIANFSNWGIIYYGLYDMSQDFASHLLVIFMVNLFLYSNFYIIMKVTHREKITFQPLVYIILSVIFWTLAMYVFLQRSTSWQTTPAESRNFNRECILLSFFDGHDVWHFLSAASMFFSFMILLTLDDDLTFIPRTKIPVF